MHRIVLKSMVHVQYVACKIISETNARRAVPLGQVQTFTQIKDCKIAKSQILYVPWRSRHHPPFIHFMHTIHASITVLLLARLLLLPLPGLKRKRWTEKKKTCRGEGSAEHFGEWEGQKLAHSWEGGQHLAYRHRCQEVLVWSCQRVF